MLLPQPQQAYEEGYEAYHSGSDAIEGNPYDCENEFSLWCTWYDGFDDAYIKEECK